MSSVLLDTHIFMWLIDGSDKLTQKAKREIELCCQSEGNLLISVISIWEIGMLRQKGRITIKEPLSQWVNEALRSPYINLIPLSPEIAIESCSLPGEFHGDPADRIITATSRVMNVSLLTKDGRIQGYAQEGHLKCISV